MWPLTTWYFKILASSAVLLIMLISCAVSFLKASLSGAKTVMVLAELRVPASPAFVTSAASVVVSGLWLAAVTTGSMAIPCMLPMPVAGIMPQSAPTVAAGSVIDAEGDAAWWGAAGAAAGAAVRAGLPQAAAVAARTPASTLAPSRRAGLGAGTWF